MNRLQRVLAALRGFARGFLGIDAAAPGDARAARRRIEEAARRREHCC